MSLDVVVPLSVIPTRSPVPVPGMISHSTGSCTPPITSLATRLMNAPVPHPSTLPVNDENELLARRLRHQAR